MSRSGEGRRAGWLPSFLPHSIAIQKRKHPKWCGTRLALRGVVRVRASCGRASVQATMPEVPEALVLIPRPPWPPSDACCYFLSQLVFFVRPQRRACLADRKCRAGLLILVVFLVYTNARRGAEGDRGTRHSTTLAVNTSDEKGERRGEGGEVSRVIFLERERYAVAIACALP